MRSYTLLDEKIKLLIYIVIPLCLGFFIVTFNYLYVISVAAIVLFFYVNPRWQFSLYTLSIFYPIVVNVGPINELPIYLIIIPLFFSSMLVAIIVKRQKLFPRDSRLFVFAIVLLLICIILGYVRNSFSVFSIDLEDHETKMIGLAYLTALAGIMAFFCSLWFFSLKFNDQNKLLRLFIFIALSVIFIKLVLVITGMAPPLFASSFTREYLTKSGAMRLGGFDYSLLVGIPALIAYSYNRLNVLRILLMLTFLILGIIGGGRTLFVGALFSIIIYLSLFYKKYSTRFLIACGVIILTMALMAQFVSLPEQIRRITGLTLLERGGFEQEDPGRFHLFTYYRDVFFENPLFGKGIGTYEGTVMEGQDIVEDQLIQGGHNAYLSILCIFGIAGGVFLCVMLFGGIIKAYSVALKNKFSELSFPYQKLVIFVMLYLITTAFYYTFSGGGYNDIKLYFAIGILLGITGKKEMSGLHSPG